MYKQISDMRKPTTFTVKHYDKTITIEIDHSDINFNEVMEVFESLTIGMGFSKDAFRDWVKEAGMDFIEEDRADEWEAEHNKSQKLKDEFKSYIANLPKEYIDDALAQHNAEEDNNEYDDYGSKIN